MAKLSPTYPPTTPNPNQRILWLLGSGQNDKRKNYIRKKFNASSSPIAGSHITFYEINKMFKFWVPKPRTKATYMLKPIFQEALQRELFGKLQTTSVVVLNDFSILAAVLSFTTGHGLKKKLMTYRGSKYYCPELFGSIPLIVVDDVSKIYIPPKWNPAATLTDSPSQSDQSLTYDIEKVIRHWSGTTNDAKVPTFDSTYRLMAEGRTSFNPIAPTTENFISSDFSNLVSWIHQQSIIAVDFEVSMREVTCIGMTGITDSISTIQTWTVPLINTQLEGGLHQRPIDFMQILHHLADAKATLTMANGGFDSTYFLKWGVGTPNYTLDMMHLWHSYRARMPKSLASVSSHLLDSYYYWKDEIKGDAKARAKTTANKYAVPTTKKGQEIYWRYCGLDCYNTLLTTIELLKISSTRPWMIKNYIKEMALQTGPLAEASYIGVLMDKDRWRAKIRTNKEATIAAGKNLEIASNGVVPTSFNPTTRKFIGCTDDQCREWLYSTLGAKSKSKTGGPKSKPSVDQKQLRLVSEQHPIYRIAINYIRAVREPKQEYQMYSGLPFQAGRFQYAYSIMGTYTGRLSGKGSNLFYGTNPQNIPATARDFIIADPGRVFFDTDYSQADLYHFAVACGDENMLNTIFNDKDTHAQHVEMILQVPYDEVMEGKKKNDPFVVHPIKGVRQIIKKLCHGGNYGMTPPTAYLNAGREALEAAAKHLGISTTLWAMKEWYKFTDQLLEPYFDAYPGQLIFRKKIVDECVANKGYATCQGGLTVYFHEWNNYKKHPELMRALLAFYGQGGTAGMINDAMLNFYYQKLKWPDGNYETIRDHYSMMLHMQTHDSWLTSLPIKEYLEHDTLNSYLNCMEISCKFNDMEYKVPTETNVGLRYSKSMIEIDRGTSPTERLSALLSSLDKESKVLSA